MATGILKTALFGGALVVAATAVGYSSIAGFKTPATAEIAAVLPTDDKAPKVDAQKVAAFVTSTRVMAEPGVATLVDMQAAESIFAAAGVDTVDTKGAVNDAEFSSLLDGLGVTREEVLPQLALPQARPTEVAQTGVIRELNKQQSRTRPKTTKPRTIKIKRRSWSTGEYR